MEILKIQFGPLRTNPDLIRNENDNNQSGRTNESKNLVLFVIFFSSYSQTVTAKVETPKSLLGTKVISEVKAVEMIRDNKCMESSTNRCMFVDPRKKKDLKRGIIKGSVLFEFKSSMIFKDSKFFAAAKRRGYNFNSYEEIKNINILSGCNGKFCPRSHDFLAILIKKLGGVKQLKRQNIKIFWVREKGVPGILSALK